MSINTTPNLHLPQWTSDEKPSWLSEMNQAFSAIDMGFAENKTANESTNSEVEQVKTNTLALEDRVSANEQGIVAVNNRVDAARNQMDNMVTLKNTPISFNPTENTATFTSSSLVYNQFILECIFILQPNNSVGTISGTVSGIPAEMSGTVTCKSNYSFPAGGSISEQDYVCPICTINLTNKTFSMYINRSIKSAIRFAGSAPIGYQLGPLSRSIQMDDVDAVFISDIN